MAAGFQRLIATRYFALGKQRSWHIFIPALICLGIYLAIFGFDQLLTHWHHPIALQLRLSVGRYLWLAKLIAGVVTVLVAVAMMLAYRLNIFTGISVYGLFLGSGALVIVLSVMSGFENDLKHKILGTNAHVVITRPDQPFTDYVALREQLSKLPGVVGATPYVLNEVMITSPSSQQGVVIKGIDPATVGQVTDLQRNTDVGDIGYLEHPEKLRGYSGPSVLHDDDFPAEKPGAKPSDERPSAGQPDEGKPQPESARPRPASPAEQVAKSGQIAHEEPPPELPPPPLRKTVPGIIVGRELAKTLRVYLGDDVSIISPFGGIGPSGPMPKSKPYRVAGIFYSGMFEYDNKYTYVALPAAQKFFAMEGQVTGIELKVADPDRSEEILPKVKALVGKSYDVEDWKELNRSLFSALKIEKILMFVLLCFIILVAAFSIIANGTMLVLEKGREIAILKAMGASDGSVLGAFMLLGLYIGLAGTGTGIAVGLFGCFFLGHFHVPLDSDVYYITSLPVAMNAYEIVAVFFAALLIALAATLYPAWMAARLRPVEGLRDAQR